MLTAKVVFPVAVLFLVSLASAARYHSRLSRVLRSNDVRSSSRAEEHREKQDWYFEQCRFVNAWKEHLGYVSVLTFLDPAWQYSFRQAVMLELLSSRLRKSGFPDIRFFVISPAFGSKNERREDDLEIEAWREIGAKYEIESFVGDNFLKGNGSEITFLQDDPHSRIWERFRASKQQTSIIDRCGKLTYHVIMPWSILFFPYVKAAILSTYMDDPCGGCDPVYRAPNHEDHITLTKITEEEEASSTRHGIDTKLEIIRTTESLENITLHHESSPEEERETSTASSILLEKITNDFNRPSLSTKLPTESTTYRYSNDATESRFDEDRPDAESTQDHEDSTNSEGTVFSETAATFESQQDVLLSERGSRLPANNNLLTLTNHEDTTDSTLLLDEPATGVTENDLTSAGEEMTATNFADEIRDNTTTKNAKHFEENAVLPLRIIMYAPHLHKNDRKTKKQTHLILKIGDPDFHGHLDSGVDVASSTGVDSRVASSEEHDWKTAEADLDEENANQNYTFDRNESPGLYGEVLDYWKSYEDNDITDRNETYNDTYNNPTPSYNKEHCSNVNNHTSLSKSEENSVVNVAEDSNVESSINLQNAVINTIEFHRPINANDQDDRDEELRYKLIEYYNKLLSWVDYRLNK